VPRALVCALALWLASGALAAPPSPKKVAGRVPKSPSGRAETGLGFTAGPVGGIGFAWRRFDEDGAGWQIGGLAVGDRSDVTVILGVQRMHTMRVRRDSRLYTLFGAMHIRDVDEFDAIVAPATFPPGPPTAIRVRNDNSSTNIGGGLGMSFGDSDGLTVALELPLVLHFDEDFDFDGLAPIPQIALVYNY
jgi:hypothetical protein